jgi:threonylcarbamoyladenosine tRNA methylthiotransferase MtaB
VPESVRDERAKILRTLSAELTDAYLRRQEGKQGEVIVQGRKGGFWCGVTGNYVDVRIVNPPLFAQRGMLLEGVFGKKADRFVEFIVTETS